MKKSSKKLKLLGNNTVKLSVLHFTSSCTLLQIAKVIMFMNHPFICQWLLLYVDQYIIALLIYILVVYHAGDMAFIQLFIRNRLSNFEVSGMGMAFRMYYVWIRFHYFQEQTAKMFVYTLTHTGIRHIGTIQHLCTDQILAAAA